MHKTEWKHINLTPRLEKARGEQERLNQMSKGQFMKNIAINTLIQLLGMLGVIGSLIFVGLEMRQSHRFALAGHYEARTNSLLNIVSGFTEGEAGYGDMVRAALGDRIEVEEAHLNGTW